MLESPSAMQKLIIKFSEQMRKAVSETAYSAAAEGVVSELVLDGSMRELAMGCALLGSSKWSEHELLSWIPETLSSSAESAFRELSEAYSETLKLNLVVDLMPELIPSLIHAIKDSSAHAIVAAFQFRWFLSQIDNPHLVNLSNLLIPCALTAIDHWSPEVKRQAMVSFIHIGKNIDVTALGCYEDAILDACCHNIASTDEIWHLVVEMSVLFVTRIHPSNPRCAWYERMLNEMLSHLERQPRNKDRRVTWLQHIEPLFNSLGLLLLAHFKRIFPLFFQWIHADDDETVLLVLNQVHAVIRLTWIRNTPYIERLVDELATLYKGASSKKSHWDIRRLVSEILILLHECKGMQFEAAYDKHREDPNLTNVFLQEEANDACFIK